ncbi:hypothetical protein Tco_1219646 [Tanacetum coccineum]
MDAKSGEYNFQLDEQWFTLNADLLRKALEITHVDSAHPFVSPPAGEQKTGSPRSRDGRLFSFLVISVRPKGKKGMMCLECPSRKELITLKHSKILNIPEYLEMVARKQSAKKGEQKKIASKADKPKKPASAKQPTLAEQTKPVKEKTSKPTPPKKTRKGKVMKVRKEKRSDHLVDEEDEEPQPDLEPQIEDD